MNRQERHSSGLDNCYNDVRRYQMLFGNPIANEPTEMVDERRRLRAKFIEEELRELTDADSIEDQCDALMDIIYFALGGFVELGVPPQRVFDLVHQANMKKTRNCGGSHRQTPEKASKPQGWIEPQHEIAEYIGELRTTGNDC